MSRFDENQYKREADKIHAPQDLIERTRAAMQAEEAKFEKKQRRHFGKDKRVSGKTHRWIGYVAAACIGLLVVAGYGGYRYRTDDVIRIQELAAFEKTGGSWELGMSLGQKGTVLEKESEGEYDGGRFHISSVKDRGAVPKELWKTEKSRIKGVDAYIGYVKEESAYYAVWEEEDIYYIASAEGMTEKSFLKNLKKSIDNL